MIPKKLEEINESVLEALLANSVAEGKTIDYKEALPGGWPTQAWLWPEWGSSLAGQSLLALFRVFVLFIPTRSPASRTAGCRFGSASNIPTLNFAKNAKSRMGHPPIE